MNTNAIEEQVILVTGSTDGIGKIAAGKLAQMGATVLVHGRSSEKCEAAAREIRGATGSEKLTAYTADLSSLEAVRTLAGKIRSEHSELHVLLNNAGVGALKAEEGRVPLSRDGHPLVFAVNYLAPFLLTHLLMPALESAAPSRIVNVASIAQEEIDFDDVMLERGYAPFRAYSQSKLALTMFTFDLADRLKGRGITVNCLHPGTLLDTKMVRENFGSALGKAESGAEVEVYVAADPGIADRTGVYFEEKRETRAHRQAYDAEARSRLRRISEELTGLR